MFPIKSTLPTLFNEIKNDPMKINAFKAANEAMGELVTSGIIGHACIHNNLITASMVTSLSKTCFSILLPMFLCTSIMKTFQNGTKGRGISLSLMVPIVTVLHCSLTYLVTKYILVPIFDINFESDVGRSTTVCCTFGNSGVIPLIFAEALFRKNHQVLQDAYSNISLYLVGWSPYFWSLGRSILLGSDGDSIHSGSIGSRDDNSNKMESYNKQQAISSWRMILIQQLLILKSLLPPPVIGIICGLIISSIPFLRKLFMEHEEVVVTELMNDNVLTTMTRSKKPIFGIVFNSLQNLGRAASPLALLVLTTSLALSSKMKDTQINDITDGEKMVNNGTATKTKNENISFIRRLLCVSLARFVVSPLLMTLILHHSLGTINKMNSMTWFMLMLESCMPPAQNSVLMLQVAEKTREATTLARFLFSIYALSMIPIVLIATLLLGKCNLTNL